MDTLNSLGLLRMIVSGMLIHHYSRPIPMPCVATTSANE
jgi:hypothetical protein